MFILFIIDILFLSVPLCVWRINLDTPEEGQTIAMDGADDRWWEQIDLTKLILASNVIERLSDDIQLLPALSVLDVFNIIGILSCSSFHLFRFKISLILPENLLQFFTLRFACSFFI